jgi:transposase
MHFIGCDVSKLKLDLSTATRTRQVKNTRSGWDSLIQWAEAQCQAQRSEICIVMEASAVYHLQAAAYLNLAGLKVLVCNPGRSADFVRSQNQLNKNDRLDAGALQRYGSILQGVHYFQPDPPEISELKALPGLLDQLKRDIRRWQNRLEKAIHQYPGSMISRSIKRQLGNLQREQARTQKAVDALIRNHELLRRNQQLMCSIRGIGAKTSQRLLPLLHGNRFESARQLAAFLGLTPCHKTSGTSVKRPGRLSARGNATVRSALYMPALSAMQHDPEMSSFYDGLIARGKLPKQATVAVMRKLVHLCYGVVKNQTPYRQNYAALT